MIDLKLNALTPADVGQMNFYLNYAREHWTLPEENPPVGLILSAKQNAAAARYAFEGIANTIVAARYRTALPEERQLVDELNKTRGVIDSHRPKPKK